MFKIRSSDDKFCIKKIDLGSGTSKIVSSKNELKSRYDLLISSYEQFKFFGKLGKTVLSSGENLVFIYKNIENALVPQTTSKIV